MRETKLEMTRGDDASFIVPAYQADGVTPQNITGATLWFTAKHRRSDVDAAAAFQKTGASIVVVDGPGGIARIDLVVADTASLPGPTTLYWDFQTRSGGKVQTLDRGKLYIRPDITRAT